MIFNRFYIGIIIQVLLIVLNSLAIGLTMHQEYMLITRVSLIVVLLIQSGILIYYTNSLNRRLKYFLESFRFENYRLTFNRKRGDKDMERIYSSFNYFIEEFENIRIQKEKEYQFFSNVIQNIGIGILGFKEDGEVLFVNEAMLKLFGLKTINNISKLDRIDQDLPGLLKDIGTEKNELISVVIEGSPSEISMKANIIKDGENIIRLVSFQDIRMEIEIREIQAWQKLIRIINHEIINSLSPVNLLSSSILKQISERTAKEEIEKLDFEEIIRGLEAIHKRSSGLTQFVEAYRNATQLPEPVFEEIRLSAILASIQSLLQEEMIKENIDFLVLQSDPDITLDADQKMIEQVILNIIRNAMQACKNRDNSKIIVNSKQEGNIACIDIFDNGEKIPEDVVPNIFIPFYTTRKMGNGIGLSLSRQIVKMHNGSLELAENSENGKRFKIAVPVCC